MGSTAAARVVVVGGGVAGLSCACGLADAGLEVVVLESGSRLGGRAYSFVDPVTGVTLDNCRHVLLGCCSATIRFLGRVGTIGLVDFLESLDFIGANDTRLRMQSSWLPPPFHLLPSMLRSGYLTAGEKLDVCRVMARVTLHRPGKQQSAREYLGTAGCSRRLMDRLLEPMLVSALNEELDQASARYARMVLMLSLLSGKGSYRLGVPKVALSELLAEPSRAYVERRGGEVRVRARVEGVNVADGRARSVTLRSGEEISCDFCVCAVPPWQLAKLGCSDGAAEQLVWRPIVSAHLFFDGSEFAPVNTCLVGEPFQWVFSSPGGYVQAVASDAQAVSELPREKITEIAVRCAARAVPETAGLPLRRAVIVREPRATFSTGYPCDAARPPSVTDTRNLCLAGDWTSTHWPATIESAVRSGIAATEAVLDSM